MDKERPGTEATEPGGRAEPEGEGGEAAVVQEAEGPPSQLEEEKARADKYMANWQRAEADFANFKRRTEQERADLVRFANASLISRLLPVVDDFERALGGIPSDVGSAGWVDGVKLIARKLRTLLEQEGVTPIDALGKEFDPHVHEAVLREDREGNADVVVAELQKGYKLHDRVLRPAMVKVAKGVGAPGRTSDENKKE